MDLNLKCLKLWSIQGQLPEFYSGDQVSERVSEGFVLTLAKSPPGGSLTYVKVMLIYSLVFFLVKLSNKKWSSVLFCFELLFYFKIP